MAFPRFTNNLHFHSKNEGRWGEELFQVTFASSKITKIWRYLVSGYLQASEQKHWQPKLWLSFKGKLLTLLHPTKQRWDNTPANSWSSSKFPQVSLKTLSFAWCDAHHPKYLSRSVHNIFLDLNSQCSPSKGLWTQKTATKLKLQPQQSEHSPQLPDRNYLTGILQEGQRAQTQEPIGGWPRRCHGHVVC